MCGFLVVLGQPFTNFAGCNAHDGVDSQIVGRLPSEDIDADVSFLQLRTTAFQGLFHDIAQQRRVSFAITKRSAGNDFF